MSSVASSIRKVQPVLQKSQQNLVPQNIKTEKIGQFHFRNIQPIHQKSQYPASHNKTVGGPTLESSDVSADVRNAGNEDWWNWIETDYSLDGNRDVSDRTDQEQADNVTQEASAHKTLTVPEVQFSVTRSDSSQISLNLPGPSSTTCGKGNIPDRAALKRTCKSKKSLTDATCPCDPDLKCVCVPDLDPAELTDDEDPDFQCDGKTLKNSVGSDSESPKKKKKMLKKSVKPKDKKALPPRNPHNLNFRDEFGNSVPVGTSAFNTRFVELDRVDAGTINKYKQEFRLFKNYVAEHIEDGEALVLRMKPNAIDKTTLTELLSMYIADRSDITHYRKTGEIKLLEPSTLDRIWYSLRYMVKKEIGFNMTEDVNFNTARDAKKSSMRLSKKTPGLGENAHAAIPWTLSMVSQHFYFF